MHNTCFRAVSSVYGRIDHLVFVHIIDGTSSADLDIILNLYKQIPNHVKYFIYVAVLKQTDATPPVRIPSEVSDFLSGVKDGEPDTRRFTLILNNESVGDVGTWVQDYFFALESETGVPALLEQIHFRQSNPQYTSSSYIADVLASETDIFLKPFPYAFNGGNILVGDDYMLVSKCIMAMNTGQQSNITEERQRITEAFRCGFGVQHILWIDYRVNGTELGHIDMFLTLGGKVLDSDVEKELVFVAQVTEDSLINIPEDEKQAVIGSYNEILDEIASGLGNNRAGNIAFKVERVPLIVERTGATELRIRPFGNALVEVYGRVRNIYIPSYTSRDRSLQSQYLILEKRATEIFEKYQFTVTAIMGEFLTASNQRGALRCCTNILKRSESERSWFIPFNHQTLNYNGNTDGVSTAYLIEPPNIIALLSGEILMPSKHYQVRIHISDSPRLHSLVLEDQAVQLQRDGQGGLVYHSPSFEINDGTLGVGFMGSGGNIDQSINIDVYIDGNLKRSFTGAYNSKGNVAILGSVPVE